MRIRSIAVLGLAALILAPGAARACENKDTLFYDSFSKDGLQDRFLLDGTPGFSTDGRMAFTPNPGSRALAITRSTFGDASICETVGVYNGPDTTGTSIGLAFWATDASNFYVLQYQPRGDAQVYRLAADKWQLVGKYAAPIPGLNKGFAEYNDLRVDTTADHATLFVNDHPIGTIEGKAPAKGQRVGFFAGSPAAGAATMVATTISVQQLPPTAAVTAGPVKPPQPVGKDGLTDLQRTVRDALLANGIDDPTGTFDLSAGNYGPAAAVGEPPRMTFRFFSNDGSNGQIVVNFGTAAAWAKYLGSGNGSGFAATSQTLAGAPLASGDKPDTLRKITIHWAGTANDAMSREDVFAAIQSDDVLITAQIVRKRSGSLSGTPPPPSEAALNDALAVVRLGYDTVLAAQADADADALINSASVDQ